MRLPDGMRQIVAAGLAGGAFLGLFFGLLLEWWLALGLAIAVYGALLLIIARRTPLDEIKLGERVTAADIASAGAALDEAVRRITRALDRAPEEDARALAPLPDHLASIRDQISRDPADYRAARRFLTVYLPRLVTNLESYADLAARARGAAARDRLPPLRQALIGQAEVVARIDAAGLENDFRALESEVEALGFQMKRG